MSGGFVLGLVLRVRGGLRFVWVFFEGFWW